MKAARRERAGAGRYFMVISPLLVLLSLWIWLFAAEGAFKDGPDGRSMGADFAMFVTAARVQNSGGNPFDRQTLYWTESAWLQREHLKITDKRATIRVGNPPLLFWALRPMAALSFHTPATWFQAAALAWIAGMALLALVGMRLVLVLAGWSRWLLAALVFLVMPQTFIGVFYGNVTAVVFAAIASALWLAQRHPFLAGIILSLAWLKPPVAIPLAMLILLFTPPRRREIATGFSVATVFMVAMTLLLVGPHAFQEWISGLLGYSHDLHLEPNLASLTGIYVKRTPASFRVALEIVTLLLAVALTARAWWATRRLRVIHFSGIAWLWFVWFLATPYSHFYDEILLALPILLLLGVNGVDVATWIGGSTLYLILFSLVLLSATPFNIEMLCLPLIPLALFAWIRRNTSQDPGIEQVTNGQPIP